MSSTATHSDPNHIGHGNQDQGSQASGHSGGGPASKRIIIGYGFWIFLISDIVMFSALFAGYAVLSGAVANGPTPRQLYNINSVALETGCLLLSSFTCGLASLAVEKRSQVWTQMSLVLTGLLGAVFLLLELREFSDFISRDAGPTRSAFLSAFFTLVGCHGLHIGIGLLWLGTMMAQFFAKGFRRDIRHRFLCFSLFWHTLDIVWVAIFTLVYLMGMMT